MPRLTDIAFLEQINLVPQVPFWRYNIQKLEFSYTRTFFLTFWKLKIVTLKSLKYYYFFHITEKPLSKLLYSLAEIQNIFCGFLFYYNYELGFCPAFKFSLNIFAPIHPLVQCLEISLFFFWWTIKGKFPIQVFLLS